MRYLTSALLVLAPVVLASQTAFSIHDDVLAYPQYEIYFSQSLISDTEAYSLLHHTPQNPSETEPPPSADTKSISSQSKNPPPSSHGDHDLDPSKSSYELMYLKDQPYLCTIPFVAPPQRNETSEAEARAAEAKELARASDRGWELLKDLEGSCLYFVSGWWSYSFCYNEEVTQFHALAGHPGKPPAPPERDPKTQMYVLGRANPHKAPVTDEWGQEIEQPKEERKGTTASSVGTELQIKGDSRYLVQKLEGGTLCDLTKKPRRVEIQYHCMPNMSDRIGYIKEVTTCSYLLVVYTPRLCSDVAFAPATENKSNSIVCRVVVPEDEMDAREKTRTLGVDGAEDQPKVESEINIGGVIVGGGKYVGKEGNTLPIASLFAQNKAESKIQVIAQGKGKAKGGKVEVLSEEDLEKLDIDPDIVEAMKDELENVAQGKGWSIQLIDEPGQERQVLMIVDDDDDADEEGSQGSEETYKKDEL